MKQNTTIYNITGIIGKCGAHDVFLGCAPACVLLEHSFADVLNEDTGEGYQRPFNRQHSLNFKQYITNSGSSTIPLTFNLRSELAGNWELKNAPRGKSFLILKEGCKSLAQVDCQHRLGELEEVDIPLAFMSFINLSLRDEMAMFTIINSRAKGLSSSLTDYHESNLLNDLAKEAPHLYIARKLNEDPKSPWFRLIRYGGETTSGLKRRTSFRMMQRSVSRFLKETKQLDLGGLDEIYALIVAFWLAVLKVFPDEWSDHRHNLISKGVGIYSLMMLLTDFVKSEYLRMSPTEEQFAQMLTQLKNRVNWHSTGTFAMVGGQKGAAEAYKLLRDLITL